MHKLITSLCTSCIMLVMLQMNAHAEWYAGASDSAPSSAILPYPNSLADQSLNLDSVDRYDLSNTSPNVSLFGGYRTNQNFSLQLEYQDELSFGIDDMFSGSSLWVPDSVTDDFESNGLFLSGIRSYPINDSGILYMKGGLFSWEVESDYYQNSEYYLGQDSGTDIFYGLGASYNLNTRLDISAEWERYQMEESDIDFLSTKFRFKF